VGTRAGPLCVVVQRQAVTTGTKPACPHRLYGRCPSRLPTRHAGAKISSFPRPASGTHVRTLCVPVQRQSVITGNNPACRHARADAPTCPLLRVGLRLRRRRRFPPLQGGKLCGLVVCYCPATDSIARVTPEGPPGLHRHECGAGTRTVPAGVPTRSVGTRGKETTSMLSL
jgi:hypothetical protein